MSEEKPSPELVDEIDNSIDELVSVHRRLLLEIAERQKMNWPPPENAWGDCRVLLGALVTLEQCKAALTRAETPQSIPSEREAVLASIARIADGLSELERELLCGTSKSWGSWMWMVAHDLIRKGLMVKKSDTAIDVSALGNLVVEHLSTRQAPIEGSVE